MNDPMTSTAPAASDDGRVRDGLEALLADAFTRAFPGQEITPHRDFFDPGGDPPKAMAPGAAAPSRHTRRPDRSRR